MNKSVPWVTVIKRLASQSKPCDDDKQWLNRQIYLSIPHSLVGLFWVPVFKLI